jgi:LysR substrate binding domain
VISFRKAFPEVKVDLLFVDHLVDIVDERIDVAVRMTASPPLSYVAKKLGDDSRRLCASPDYLARRGRPARPSDLQKHDCLVFMTERAPVPWKLRSEAGKPVSVRVCGPLRANNTLSLREAALAGLGIADLPSYLVADDVRAGRLEAVLGEFVAAERAVYALYAAGPSLPARSREFVKLLVRHFHEDEAREALPRLRSAGTATATGSVRRTTQARLRTPRRRKSAASDSRSLPHRGRPPCALAQAIRALSSHGFVSPTPRGRSCRSSSPTQPGGVPL